MFEALPGAERFSAWVYHFGECFRRDGEAIQRGETGNGGGGACFVPPTAETMVE